ncbi:Uncharacterised protein [Mycobacteroides abscessus subsp. abscessus]|nr:Uncharacterised protein [Mycobacteroides abscessus subsp. abscessus]SHU99399.1 Uncharacterised protein [Mycobacteroides abscessus subsp. abscessus]SHV59526.1 Uncharacterised protein [Mycobacteroides abscessus subsp. abscessus]SHV82601.1 Uncharacterised protein [Mycobacteroides abscessus subsp. abscessus]SHW23306.1 Uncharacterised protein [Mycobacteroides abscessus subsp. abscessus]
MGTTVRARVTSLARRLRIVLTSTIRGWCAMSRRQSDFGVAYEIKVVPSPAQGNDTFEAWHSEKSKPSVVAFAYRGAWVFYVDPAVERVLADPVGHTGMKIQSRVAALEWVDLFAHRYVSAVAK